MDGRNGSDGLARHMRRPTSQARRTRRVAAVLLCALLLASCGASPSPDAQSTSPTSISHHASAHPNAQATATAGAASGSAASTLNEPPLGISVKGTVGCGEAAIVAPGTSANQVLISQGQRRSYRLHVPSGYSATSQTSLVLNFHGDGGDGGQMEEYTGLSALADEQGFLVAYPNGLPTVYGWTAWGGVGNNMPVVDDVQFTSDLIDEISQSYCVDPHRIYAMGFSRGGGMAALLACRLSDRIAAFASVSGSFFSSIEQSCAPSRPVPILDFHGSADDVVPYDGGGDEGFLAIPSWLGGWAARDGCAKTPQAVSAPDGVSGEQWTGCQGGSVVVHYRIEGAGHEWPGGDGSTHVIDASQVAWSFFQAHPLP